MSVATNAEVAGGSVPPVASATGVSKRFGATVALNNVGLSVAPGEVHALVGRNGAGKSTLVSLLTGLAAPDVGELRFNGELAPSLVDRAGWRHAVACVYQKLTIVDTLTVAENLFLHRQTTSSPVIDWKQLRRRASELLASWEMNVDVTQPAGQLTVEQRQLVEIARALSFGARFIILDEPTARLDAAGIARLFDRIRLLQRQGVTFLFISHHLQEVFELCQNVTVFRDARQIVTAPVAEISRADLVDAMTGEHVTAGDDPRPPRPAVSVPVLDVVDVSVDADCSGVSFQVLPGEIVGLAGGGGSGKFAVGDSIVGLRRPTAGEVKIGGKVRQAGSVAAALRAGVGFVPQDRHRQGLVAHLSIAENLTMTVSDRLGRYGYVSPARRTRFAEEAIRDLGIVAPGPGAAASSLSGGNQQKVVMGRAIANEPRLLVMMAPTAGVDVRSKEALMSRAVDMARNGAGVLVVSDDLDDLRYCHRVVIMFRGEVVAEVCDQWDDATVVAAMEGVELDRD